ncbi:MAG: hypothetical protein CBB92_11365 [Flammeovirgaceae bacterium TMED32]|nr:MAG: hypothetical protein CBB92_11365 [Flammeovirgaceae bacterium TMED32]|tara:strand:+ start:580 stop:993 length:414 start_codon:yes stop_codon:yes gene_type:complete
MTIPTSLIPEDEKKPINKKRLAVAITVISMLVLPLAIGIVSGLTSLLKAPVEDDKIFAIGVLSAFKCQLDNGYISSAKGQAILEEIASKNNIDRKVFEDSDLRKVAILYSKTLDKGCFSTVRNEKEAINKIYRSKIK